MVLGKEKRAESLIVP